MENGPHDQSHDVVKQEPGRPKEEEQKPIQPSDAKPESATKEEPTAPTTLLDTAAIEQRVAHLMRGPIVNLGTVTKKQIMAQLVYDDPQLSSVVQEHRHAIRDIVMVTFDQIRAERGLEMVESMATPVKRKDRESASSASSSSMDEDDERPAKAKKKKAKKNKTAGQSSPRAAGSTGGFNAPMLLSETLGTFLGEKELPRPQVVKRMWEYIKANELQNPNDKREILCDEKLRGIFGQDKITMFSMKYSPSIAKYCLASANDSASKLLVPHLYNKADVVKQE